MTLYDTELYRRVDEFAATQGIAARLVRDAKLLLVRMSMHTGRSLRELTVDDVLELRAATLASGRAGWPAASSVISGATWSTTTRGSTPSR
jgi:hypothetical protein